MKKKIKILAQENNQVCLLEEMTNASALSEIKPPLLECSLIKQLWYNCGIVSSEIYVNTILVVGIFKFWCQIPQSGVRMLL